MIINNKGNGHPNPYVINGFVTQPVCSTTLVEAPCTRRAHDQYDATITSEKISTGAVALRR